MNEINILDVMGEKYGDNEDINNDLYTFGGVLEYDLMDDVTSGGMIEDDEHDGKVYLDDMPELDELVNKKGGGAKPVRQAEFLAFLNKLARLEK
tara:strand:- start:3563 stop:3844 length:282 start_codon:yes stop_codon:yes gene_type:complete